MKKERDLLRKSLGLDTVYGVLRVLQEELSGIFNLARKRTGRQDQGNDQDSDGGEESDEEGKEERVLLRWRLKNTEKKYRELDRKHRGHT